MITHEEFFGRLVETLERLAIPYMVAGSVASSLYGEPRNTYDFDVVINPTAEQLRRLIDSFGKDYYVSPEAAQDAFQNRSMFNVIDLQTGWKADFVLRKDRPFSLEEFERRQTIISRGITMSIVSPEDAILSKLEWSKLGESERQLRDVRGIAVVQGDKLDKAYLRKWAQELGVADRLEQILNEAAKLQPPSPNLPAGPGGA